MTTDPGGQRSAPETVMVRTARVHQVAIFSVTASEDVPLVGPRWRREHIRVSLRHHDDIVIPPDVATRFRSIMRGDACGMSIH